jgi:hypothetical protein
VLRGTDVSLGEPAYDLVEVVAEEVRKVSVQLLLNR